ncbi:MAG: hypothetical protein PF495_05570 [Spirochaetales bacterium]|jgi:hypothetical protein|nr:hypothetical protein [Spirochaetales bacterium]
MKKITVSFAVMFFLSVTVIAFTEQVAFAIGQWHEGTVTKSPWTDKYTFIQIDNVKYTIMKDAKIVNTYQKKGATYKDRMSLHSILDGNRLFYKNEGNRIYQIEKIR